MKVIPKKQIVYEVNEEEAEFINEMRDFCLHVRMKFSETDEVYKTMEDMEAFLSDLKQGKPFETHK